jgi:hypothetical protein
VTALKADPWPDHPSTLNTPLGVWLRAHTTPFDVDLVGPPAGLAGTAVTA